MTALLPLAASVHPPAQASDPRPRAAISLMPPNYGGIRGTSKGFA